MDELDALRLAAQEVFDSEDYKGRLESIGVFPVPGTGQVRLSLKFAVSDPEPWMKKIKEKV